MAIRLKGYRRAPGTARRYVTPEGESITYQQYRKRVEAAGAVQHLDVVALAKRRLSQRVTNDIIGQMAKVRREAIDRRILEIEYQVDEGIIDEDDAFEEVEDLRRERRQARRAAVTSQSRKEALKELKAYGAERSRARREHRPVGEEADRRMVEALTTLGRREGIPDWVPVGASDAYRKGRFARAA